MSSEKLIATNLYQTRENLNTGGLVFSATDLNASQNPKQDISSIQKRMLTQSEIESLQKNKRESLEELYTLFNKMDIRSKIAQKLQ